MRNAWLDLYLRRPEDKQFKLAHRLRLELSERGWTLPERRKYRCRLEDVAFD